MPENELSLYQLVKMVREDLKTLKDDYANEEEHIMILNTVDLELKMSLASAKGGGIKFLILSGDIKVEKEFVSTIKLTFRLEGVQAYH